MKKSKMVLLMLLILVAVFVIPFKGENVQAAKPKVTKVKMKEFYNNDTGKAYYKFYGKTKKGKTAWVYKTKRYDAFHLSAVSWKVHKNTVVIFETGKLVKLNKQTGKCTFKAKKPFVEEGYGLVIGFDNKDCMYVHSFFHSEVYKLSPKGKVLWKKDICKNYDYEEVSSIAVKKGKVKVKCSRVVDDALEDGHYVVLNAKNGKILGEK